MLPAGGRPCRARFCSRSTYGLTQWGSRYGGSGARRRTPGASCRGRSPATSGGTPTATATAPTTAWRRATIRSSRSTATQRRVDRGYWRAFRTEGYALSLVWLGVTCIPCPASHVGNDEHAATVLHQHSKLVRHIPLLCQTQDALVRVCVSVAFLVMRFRAPRRIPWRVWRARWLLCKDLIAESHALIADINTVRPRNEAVDLILVLPAERAKIQSVFTLPGHRLSPSLRSHLALMVVKSPSSDRPPLPVGPFRAELPTTTRPYDRGYHVSVPSHAA